MIRRLRDEPERGETLLEVVVAIMVLGVAAVAITAGMALTVKVSDIHRKQANATAYVRNYAEAIEQSVTSTGYQATCAPTYASSFSPGTGYSAAIKAVSFWNGATFPTGTCSASDVGLQQLTLQVKSTDNRAVEQLVIVLRQPCANAGSQPC